MSTETKTIDTDFQALADHEAVMRQLIDGTPLDPEVADRVEERAARITEEIRRVHGVIDDETFNALPDDEL